MRIKTYRLLSADPIPGERIQNDPPSGAKEIPPSGFLAGAGRPEATRKKYFSGFSAPKTRTILTILALTAAITSTSTSCQKTGFLDQTVTTSLDETSTFTDSSNAMQFLNNIYSNIGYASDPKRFNAVGQIYAAGLEAACDEAEGPASPSNYGNIQFATGSVNPTVVPSDAWSISVTTKSALSKCQPSSSPGP